MKGFTLIEILVVSAITVLITGFMVTNFSRTRVDLNQTVLTVQDAVRSMQSKALAGSLYGSPGAARCGYGIKFLENGYTLYVGPDASAVDCVADDHQYTAGVDTLIQTAILPNTALEIGQPYADIFFEPPNPTTYINGSNAAGVKAAIIVRRKGALCPSTDCRTINVTTSGQIQ